MKFFCKKIAWRDSGDVFQALYAREPYAFWLDSSRTGENGRFSFMGASNLVLESKGNNLSVKKIDPRTKAVTVHKKSTGDPFELFRKFLAPRRVEGNSAPFDFRGGLVGYLGYELKEFLGFSSRLRKKSAVPDSLMMVADRFIAFDHKKKECYACSVGTSAHAARDWAAGVEARLSQDAQVSNWKGGLDPFKRETFVEVRHAISKPDYIRKIKTLLQKIRDGETYEACLTNEFFVPGAIGDPLELYDLLRRTNPAPYSAFLRFPGASVLSSSPESFLNLSSRGRVRSEPIKGTRAVGKNRRETESLIRELKHSGKDRSELLMIIDLIRNDLSKVCRKGSVKVKDFMRVTEHATVLQLSSVITGELDRGFNAIDLLRAAFPGGSITGAPKHRTVELIDRLERRPRGVYTGSIGYFSYNGAMDLNIAIRTMVAGKDGVRFGSGGAVVHESDPEKEYREILLKAYAILRAVVLEKSGEFRYDSIEYEKYH